VKESTEKNARAAFWLTTPNVRTISKHERTSRVAQTFQRLRRSRSTRTLIDSLDQYTYPKGKAIDVDAFSHAYRPEREERGTRVVSRISAWVPVGVVWLAGARHEPIVCAETWKHVAREDPRLD
jgi:hypothetical protein